MTPRIGALLSAGILALGVAQVGLVILAFARILDPGWATFTLVAILSALGMSSVALAAALFLRWTRPTDARFAWLGVGSGFLLAAIWATLPGGIFYTYDLGRIAVVVLADSALAASLVAAVRFTSNRDVLPGLMFMAVFMSVLTAFEIVAVAFVTLQSDARFVPTLILSGGVLVKWFVFALWEILLGASVIHDVRSNVPELATRR